MLGLNATASQKLLLFGITGFYPFYPNPNVVDYTVIWEKMEQGINLHPGETGGVSELQEAPHPIEPGIIVSFFLIAKVFLYEIRFSFHWSGLLLVRSFI